MEEWEAVLHRPLETIERLYQEDPNIVNNLSQVSEHFRSKVAGHEAAIPWYNSVPLECLPPNTIVRFRGMIQDMMDPEFYLATYSSTDTTTGTRKMNVGAYTEPAEKPNETIDFENPSNVTLERQTYYCVPVPGENKWVGEMFVKNSTFVAQLLQSSTNKKRVLNSGMDVDGDEAHSMEKKVKADDEEMVDDVHTITNGHTDVNMAKFDANHPLPDGKGPTCFITLYSELNDLKMNEVVEFLCILDTSFHVNNQHNGNADAQEAIARLHCLYYNRLPTLNLDIATKSLLYKKTITELTNVRNEFMQILEEVFGGDVVAAEYFLLHLISRTYTVVGVLCVGKICLNLSNVQCEGFTLALYRLVQKVTEKSYCLPLTIDNLNKLKYTPTKDYEANRLVSGVLQLSDDTNLVLDETQMQPGKLEAGGVNNLKAVGNLIQWQNVDYDFKFSRVEMKTKVNALILSEGKSILANDCQIPLRPEEQINLDKINSLVDNISPTLLERIRIYLTVVRTVEYDLPEQVSKALQDDFVELRKEDPKACSTEWFSMLLTISRFMAMSYGLGVLDAPLWTRTKELDAERMKRMPSKTA